MGCPTHCKALAACTLTIEGISVSICRMAAGSFAGPGSHLDISAHLQPDPAPAKVFYGLYAERRLQQVERSDDCSGKSLSTAVTVNGVL